MASEWHNEPAVVAVLRKLQELSLRAARLQLAQKMRRTQAMLAALERPHGAAKGASHGVK
jgi:hypothetical protein